MLNRKTFSMAMALSASMFAARTGVAGPITSVPNDPFSPAALETTSQGLGGPRGFATYTTGFEASEGFTSGAVIGSQPATGWTNFAGRTQGTVSTVDPATGAQHMRIAKQSDIGAGSLTGGFSPNLGALPVLPTSMSIDVNISATGGADYDVVPQAPSQSFLTARVKFSFGDFDGDSLAGDILVLDDVGGGVLDFVDTGVDYIPGTYEHLQINVNPAADSIEYFLNGNLIHTGSVFAGTTIEQVVLVSDNFQNPGETGDFDNLRIAPEPGTLSLLLLGIGGLLHHRRRS